ncbi:PP2C family protein-serine/threonine phosphatase [Streptomyces antarcticus]|uniref:PP2C family protein-serine/threonine phosphatase n=1 Tax=Streptomyces antarcticus TaxID=2996458 RepID=UPI002270F317|nr:MULTISPECIES: PP2C family protein-serine/threonine phosphatase [unclassified Streptomyces]MCY0939839.1 PP2C family protein-serine/threonine phosphatase [Streptomyces sp. H34-AA3]MCZ4081009.1 PP2C family protein-serine/threonine phosphatase [Streptomyces sp. H34-S5]
MNIHRYSTLPLLRQAVRSLAHAHRLPADVRGRLVLSVTALAAPEFHAGRPVALTASCENGPGDGGLLAVTFHASRFAGPLATSDLPLPAPATSGPTATWHIPTPAADPHRAGTHGPNPPPADPPILPPAESRDSDEELRAALALADSLAAGHRLLKHELAETNAGVVALYVQLEEQDEQLRKAHGQVLRELEDALRPPPPLIPGLDLAVHYAPADPGAPTGGDLYDWFTLPDGTLHITIVDAVGHGVRSTRSALNVTHAVRTLALEGHPLQSILARTHDILMPLDPRLMATVLLARIDPATGELQLANGSHPPALLVRSDDTAQYLEVRGRGIGFPLPGSDRVLSAHLDPGDLLLLYTDGLTESRKDVEEGEIRLVQAARTHAHLPLAGIPTAIAADMHTIVLHADDTLAMALRITLPPL